MKQNRNDKCTCNSGKKFKHCCGSAESFNKNKEVEKQQRIKDREEYLKNRNTDKSYYEASMLIQSALALMSGQSSRFL